MQGLGLDVDLWRLDLDALRADADYPGEEVEREEAWGCVGASDGAGRDGGTPALILNGHVDVVPPGEQEWWTGGDPWHLQEIDDRWYGRGVCDMKGGVVAILAAVRAVGYRLTRPFAVHTVVGEEDGGIGTFGTLRRGHIGEACLIAEPTDGEVVSANAGALTFRVEIRGRATHGSMAGYGISAIDLYEHLRAVLRDLDARRNTDPPEPFGERPWPISVGMIQAGDWSSTVPDLLVAEGRFGVMPGESFADATAVFEKAVASVEDPWLREHPIEVHWQGGQFAAGALPSGHPFGDEVATAIEGAGGAPPRFVGAPYGSDLRQYAAVGIPTVQFGPGDIRQAHAVNENVAIGEVVRCADTYVQLLLSRCG
jgi:acetylornithine deacetylase